jgi:hypothetical protein
MRRSTVSVLALLVCATLAGTASAASTGFVSDPYNNSSNWLGSVSGASVSTIDFENHPLGTLWSNFYPGVTLSANGDVNTVKYGAGPAQGNTNYAITGEGYHAASNYLYDDENASSLTISFDQPVLGAGLFVIDHFNPGYTNWLTIEAFTGANGTGTSLGLYQSVQRNFQRNYKYFMGVTSSEANIRSLVFTDVNSETGDTTGIDDIMFATGDAPPVPEPMTMLGLTMAVGAAGAYIRRRRA